jgi:hypothetical protein
MPYIISIVLLFSSFLYAGNEIDKTKMSMVLQSWDRANNTKDIDTLSRLYASKILYYGSRYSRQKCLKDKKRFFRKYPHFSQTVQNAAYVTLSPTRYKIIFDKYVRMRPSDKYRIYPSYLLVDTSSAFPAIVEEGDSVTDKNIKRAYSAPMYTLDSVHELKGKIKLVHYYGPPSYGEDPQHDKKLIAYILVLDAPIQVVALEGSEVSFSMQTTELQLLAFDYQKALRRIANKRSAVTVRGEFFSAHTGYHIRDVLIDVQAINP